MTKATTTRTAKATVATSDGDDQPNPDTSTVAEVEGPPNHLRLDIELDSDDATTVTKTLWFKTLAVVPIGILRTTRNDQQEQMWKVFEWALPEADLACFDELPADKLMDILRQMQTKSGLDLGE